MLRSVRPRLSLCLFRARSSKRCILGLQLLQNTNRKPHAESQTYWSAWPCGHRKWPKRAENIVSQPLSGRYLVSCPLRYSFSGFGMQNVFRNRCSPNEGIHWSPTAFKLGTHVPPATAPIHSHSATALCQPVNRPL